MNVFNGPIQEVRVAQKSIRANGHEHFNTKQNKVALSAIDDKRYVLPDDNTRFFQNFSMFLIRLIIILKLFVI